MELLINTKYPDYIYYKSCENTLPNKLNNPFKYCQTIIHTLINENPSFSSGFSKCLL